MDHDVVDDDIVQGDLGQGDPSDSKRHPAASSAAPTAPASIGFHTEWKIIARRLDAMKESSNCISWISSDTRLFLLSSLLSN